MNQFKVIHEQDKYMEATWWSGCGGGSRFKLAGAKKRLEDGEELNKLVTLAVAKYPKTSKKKNVDNQTNFKNGMEQLDFKNIDIGSYSK